MKQKRLIVVACLATPILLLGVFGLANRHRAIIRQPVLFTRCLVSLVRDPDASGSSWSRVVSTVRYFWGATQVHIGPLGEWHCLPIYHGYTEEEKEISDLTFSNDVEVSIIETEDTDQQENP